MSRIVATYISKVTLRDDSTDGAHAYEAPPIEQVNGVIRAALAAAFDLEEGEVHVESERADK